MKECQCGEEMFYNIIYQCYECEECGKVYNSVGQELAPVNEWADEWNENY